MANILFVAVTLVMLYTNNSYCKTDSKEDDGLEKRQYIVLGGGRFRYNYPIEIQNPMRKSNTSKIYNTAPLATNVTSKRPKTNTKNESFGDNSLQRDKSHPAITTSEVNKLSESKEKLKLPITKFSKSQRKNLLGKAIKKASTNPEASPVTYDVTASKRVAPAVAGALTKLATNEKVQEAAIDKGIEVAGKLVDKYFENIDQAQEKAADFLKKEIKLNIMPDKGWETQDMFVPPGYHIDAEIDEDKSSTSVDDPVQPYTYPAGMGGIMMNGCWGSNYQVGDPCYNAMEKTDQCRDMIDGAAFIGVGFDGRGEYSPQSRKMSLIQRSCGGHSSYDGLQVPDTMNVHGIYDTSAHMSVFTSRSEYQKYLQGEAGVSGSYFGFSAGVKSAWGSSESGAQQSNLAIFDIDVDRYEIFQDEVKPQDLSRNFLREFVSLPNSYFAPGAPAKFQDFILRWGTHYIKSARFGGQLELRKLQLASMTSSKEQFSVESEFEFKSLFWSVGGKVGVESGESSKSQRNYMSTSVVVQGGSQRIAAIISDMYSPTFKTEFTAWLESIPAYPKAFKFLMGSITDLLDFRANDLFPDETIEWGCELNKNSLEEDETAGKSYYLQQGKRVYCEYTSREDMEYSLKRKRVSLKRAIEVYMEEGTMSISDVSLPAGEAGCQTKLPEYQSQVTKPSWREMKEHKRFRVMFDLLEDLRGAIHGGIDIPKSMSRIAQFSQGKWYTTNRNGEFHLYDGFNNGGSGNTENKKISIFGLVLKYDETQGSLTLHEGDYEASKRFFPELSDLLKGRQLARVEWPTADSFTASAPSGEAKHRRKGDVAAPSTPPPLPCNLQWSNGLRFDPSDRNGKCLHFTASSKGTVYAVFSAVPSNKDMWYYVQIAPFGVAIYKSQRLKVSTVNSNAVALGDNFLYQSYFVCVTESPTSTVIEYGKSHGTTDSGDVYLTTIDHDQPIHARFYSFGNAEEPAQIVDSHVISRALTTTECKGDTYEDKDEPNCVQKCHEACAPLAGCQSRSQGDPKASECNECRYAKNQDNVCITECPAGQKPNKEKNCMAFFDLKFKPEAGLSDSDITGFPTLNEMAICFWINFQEARGSEDKVLDYVNEGQSHALFSITAYIDGTDSRIQYLIGDKGSKPSPRRFLKLNKDDKWHIFCVNRDSKTGMMGLFINGENSFKGSYDAPVKPGRVPEAGGTMHLGGFGESNFRGKISGVNIWNRILTETEISKMAHSCGDSAGNLKDWFDIKRDLTLDKYTVTAPSHCRVST